MPLNRTYCPQNTRRRHQNEVRFLVFPYPPLGLKVQNYFPLFFPKFHKFLPNNYIATCDTGFTQLYDNYKTIAKNKSETISNDFVLLSDIFKCSENLLCLTDEEYKIYEEHLKYFAEPNVATVNNITN